MLSQVSKRVKGIYYFLCSRNETPRPKATYFQNFRASRINPTAPMVAPKIVASVPPLP